MIQFFQESDGDYLAIDTETNRYYLERLGQDHFEGRATALVGVVGSVCGTSISREFLQAKCRRVRKAKVPVKWRRAIGY